MNKKEKIKKIILYLWYSRGFSWARGALSLTYVSLFEWVLSRFIGSLKNHFTQMWCIIAFLVIIPLGIRSFKRLLDEKQMNAVFKYLHKVSLKVNEKLDKLAKKVMKWLGIDKILRYGKDERSFIFFERNRGQGKKHKLVNPMFWEEQQSNAEKVRYIFTDYMIDKIREGYRMRQSETPKDIENKLAGSDEEHLLFDTYTIARYSGGREEISDATVDALDELVPDKKRKRKSTIK